MTGYERGRKMIEFAKAEMRRDIYALMREKNKRVPNHKRIAALQASIARYKEDITGRSASRAS